MNLDNSRLIKRDFKRLGLPLPQPSLRPGDVGILCPVCDADKKTTPLKYINQLPNASWRVACGIMPPRGQHGHWYRIWSDLQLKHEIASINAGNWPAVPYPNATSTCPLAPTPSQTLFNRLFTPTASVSSSVSPRAASFLICGGVNGQTGPTHQIQDSRRGNQQCLFKACASCCQTLVDQTCGAKGHRKPDVDYAAIQPILNIGRVAGAVASTSDVNRVVSPAIHRRFAAEDNLPTHRRIPTQSAQSGGRIACQFNSVQLARLFDMRSERDHSTAENNKFEADKSKVVHVTAWLKAGDPPSFFSFLAPRWPSFSLQQCHPLVNAAALEEGLSDGWSRRLSFWEPKLEGWRTVSIDIPSRLPIGPREIFVKGERIKPEECPRLEQLINSVYESKDINPRPGTPAASSSITTSTYAATPPEKALSQNACSTPRLKNRAGLTADEETTTGSIIIDLIDPALNANEFGSGPDSNPAKNASDTQSSASPSSIIGKSTWPDLDLPIGDILEWSQLTEQMTVLSAWDVFYGGLFFKKDHTIYLHASWIGKLRRTPEWDQWLQHQTVPAAAVTLRSARKHFHQEFIRAGHPPSQPTQPSITSSSRPSKRKLGE